MNKATIPLVTPKQDSSPAVKCDLCYGDEWVTDTFDYLAKCTTDEERDRFIRRIGVLKGVMAGRMLCPRCRVDE